MKNLLPLTRKISYWDEIVDSKILASRTPLQAIRHQVLSRFNVYSHCTIPNTLQAIVASPFAPPNIALLQGCYSTSKNLARLKTKIREKQNLLLRGECQYCNISEPNTFDHYLPQSQFPEFSALSINLIPCCSKCNTAKGEEWLLNGARKVLNFYYDPIPHVQYLNCAITYNGGVPQANFSIDTSVIPITLRFVIDNHFTTLDLLDRYKKKSNSEITDVLNAISPNAVFLSRMQIQTTLRREASRMQASKGTNYWRAIIRLALADTNRFLDGAGY